MFSHMCPKGIHFGPQKLVLELTNCTQHLCFLAHGIKSSFEVVLVSLGGRTWTSFGMHLGGPGRATSVLGVLDFRSQVLAGVDFGVYLGPLWLLWVAFLGFFERTLLFVAFFIRGSFLSIILKLL